MLDPSRLLPLLLAREGEGAFARKHAKLNAAIAELVEDFSLVSFGTLNITDKQSVARALRSIDKANGYCFGDPNGADLGIFTCAAGEPEWDDERVGAAQERYMTEADLAEELGPGPSFAPGDEVTITGLRGSSELNGEAGIVKPREEWPDNGRIGVLLLMSQRSVSVNAANLRRRSLDLGRHAGTSDACR